MKVFVLEDDPIFQDLIKSRFEADGHSVVVCESMEGATDAIKSGNFDLMTIDILLPEKLAEPGIEIPDGGIQVLEQLKADGFDPPPTIFISIHGFPKIKGRVEKLGLNQTLGGEIIYFQKPYNHALLQCKIREIEERISGSK